MRDLDRLRRSVGDDPEARRQGDELIRSEWGADQADRYLDELDSNIKLLVDNLDLGIKRDFVSDGYRVLFVASHAVYYTVNPSTIHIIRVLHGRMDPLLLAGMSIWRTVRRSSPVSLMVFCSVA
jgi:plasmid stabilization system protein ParE